MSLLAFISSDDLVLIYLTFLLVVFFYFISIVRKNYMLESLPHPWLKNKIYRSQRRFITWYASIRRTEFWGNFAYTPVLPYIFLLAHLILIIPILLVKKLRLLEVKQRQEFRKLDTSLIVDEIIKCYSYFGKQFGNSLKVNHNYSTGLSTLLSNIYPRELKHRYT